MKLKKFNITFLGTSAASINPFSPTSTCLVQGGDTKIMVDVGIGALRQLHRIHIDSEEIDAVLITHWHFDHFAGLPALVKSRKRTSALSIYGPKLSIPARIYLIRLLPSAPIYFEAVTENFSTDCGDIHVETVPTIHDIISSGWVLTERVSGEQGGIRRILISGDTRPTQSIIGAAREADLLVHEATYLDKHANRAYRHGHSTVTEVANLAIKARVGALALTHIANQYSKLSALKEAEKIFPVVLVPSLLDRIYIEPVPNSAKMGTFGWGHVRMVGD
ncbi:MBL fold metallo-hydrolase [Chloroflexota bacterium]